MADTEYRTKIGDLDEIILNIFGFLGVQDVLKASLVCKRWHRIGQDNTVWRNLVLQRWPSQRPVLCRVSTVALQWQKIYRNLSEKGRYSPDDMKYLIVCKVGEQQLVDCGELKDAVLTHVEEVTSLWEKPGLYEMEETSSRFFNGNMELYYDTHDLKWVFVDRRREYVDDSFTIRLNLNRMTSRQMRFIRPYQVMASCVMMYRWLVVFKQMFTEDVGLTFYRIWRFRLRHKKTGLIFETYDWKAAMSSTFSHGCPLAASFRDAGLAILNMLSSPFFIMHPMGSSAYKIWYEIALSSERSSSSDDNASSSSSVDVFEVSNNIETRCVSQSSSSDTMSSSGKSIDEAESENGDEMGYYCNCDSFIHRSSWEYEEQQMIQAETASKWEVILLELDSTFEVVFDSSEERWLFCKHDQHRNPLHPEILSRKIVDISLEASSTGQSTLTRPIINSIRLPSSEERSDPGDVVYGLEAMPTSLTLYRLICMFDLNSMHYRSLENKSVWSISLQHRLTRGIIQLKDLNGWLRVSVKFNEELQLFCNDLALMSLNESLPCYLQSEPVVKNTGNLKPTDDGQVAGCSKTIHASSEQGDKEMMVPSNLTVPLDQEVPPLLGAECSSKDGGAIESTGSPSEDSDGEFGNPLERFKNDVCSLLQLLINQKFAHPYGTVAGAVA